MKKFLSAILSFAMIFALSIPAFAADITVAPTETVTNEYQSMLELQKISNATLAAEGYTPSEIETIRNTDQIFDDHIALLNITPPSRTIISTPARDTAFLFSVGSPALTLKLSLV